MRVAVVGHVEWIEFAEVERVPAPGEIVHALATFEEPGGGGAVAAVQLARLAGQCLFLTALGDEATGHRAKRELEALGVRVEAAWRPEPQRRAFVHLDADSERTITVMGERIGPHAADALPWSELEDADAVYFTAGDPGAVRAARAARKLVASARAVETLADAGVRLDALVSSARDRGERYMAGAIDPPPLLVVRTAGAAGGSLVLAEDHDAVNDEYAQEEDAERPPGMVPTDGQQSPDCAEAAADYSDHPPVGVARHQREASGELDHTEDDENPAERVEVRQDEPRVVDEDVRIVQGADAVDDVDRAHDQQDDGCEYDATRTSH